MVGEGDDKLELVGVAMSVLVVALAVGVAGSVALFVAVQLRARRLADEAAGRAAGRVRVLEAREADLIQSRQEALLEQRWAMDTLSGAGELVLAYSVLADSMPGSYVFANDAACRTLGYERDQILSMSPVQVEVFRNSGGSPSGGDMRFTVLHNTAGLAEEGSYARRGMELLIGQILREKSVDYGGGFVAVDGRQRRWRR